MPERLSVFSVTRVNLESTTGPDIRDIPEAHLERALDLAGLVFHVKREDEKYKRDLELLRGCERIGAYDGEQLVGLLATLPFSLSVPGGELPCPGVSFVSVAPTHRRRGILSALLGELFRRCRADGRPLTALWASEAAIYGRFGFGNGTFAATVEIDSDRPLKLRIDPDPRPLRLLDADETVRLLGPAYEVTRARRPGRPARSEEWWRRHWLVDVDEEDEDLSPPRVVALGEPGEEPAGYAVYRTKGGDDTEGTTGLVRLDELEAGTPQAAAALWRYLTEIDLTGTVRAWGRPLDDPLLSFAGDRDQVRVTGTFPALWLRLVDVRAALEGRTWSAPLETTLRVHDDRVPANSGLYRLRTTAADGGGSATGTAVGTAHDLHVDFVPEGEPGDAGEPDLTFAVRDLASCCLGTVPVSRLVRAGLVTEHAPGAAAALEAALATELMPHTVEEF